MGSITVFGSFSNREQLESARRYDALLHRGEILAALHADNASWVKKAKRVLEGTGAQHIFEADEAKGAFMHDRPKLRKAS